MYEERFTCCNAPLSFCVKPSDMGQMKEPLWTCCMSGSRIVCHILSKYLDNYSALRCWPTEGQQRLPVTVPRRGRIFRDGREKQPVTARLLSRHTESAECGRIHWPDTDSGDQCAAALLMEWTGSQGRIGERQERKRCVGDPEIGLYLLCRKRKWPAS